MCQYCDCQCQQCKPPRTQRQRDLDAVERPPCEDAGCGWYHDEKRRHSADRQQWLDAGGQR